VKRAAGAVIVITCASCAGWRRPEPRPAVVYTCRVPQPPPPAIPTFDMPAGRLELQLLEAPAAPTSPDGGSPLDGSPIAGRRLRVVAEAVHDGIIHLDTPLGARRRYDPQPLEVRIIPVPKNIPPAQAADAACAFALSDSGSASAAGQNLVVRDGPEHLLKVEALMRALAARANGSRPPEAADPPAQAE
jgi:hypothetical protein